MTTAVLAHKWTNDSSKKRRSTIPDDEFHHLKKFRKMPLNNDIYAKLYPNPLFMSMLARVEESDIWRKTYGRLLREIYEVAETDPTHDLKHPDPTCEKFLQRLPGRMTRNLLRKKEMLRRLVGGDPEAIFLYERVVLPSTLYCDRSHALSIPLRAFYWLWEHVDGWLGTLIPLEDPRADRCWVFPIKNGFIVTNTH